MFLHRYVGNSAEFCGFPSSVRSDANSVLTAVRHNSTSAKNFFVVNFNGEKLSIPYRVNFDAQWMRDELSSDCSGIEKNIISCLGTRHTNGYVRQEFLENLFRNNESWTIPYIIQLGSEYVVEIVDIVLENIRLQNVEVLQKYFLEYPTYFKTFEARVANYWSHYYRHLYTDKKLYPGMKVLDFLRSLQ